MSTVRDLVRRSLTLIGVLASGEPVDADMLEDGRATLNDMLGSWSNEGLTIVSKVRETLTIASGQVSQTFGLTGDFASARPLEIESLDVVIGSGQSAIEIPLKKLTSGEYDALQVKYVQAPYPTHYFNDGGYPLSRIYFWPVPSQSNSLSCTSWKPFASFAAAGDSVDFPPGYAKAVRYNLAIELCPEYSKEAPAEVVQGAMESKDYLKRMNIKSVTMSTDLPGVGRAFNIITGD